MRLNRIAALVLSCVLFAAPARARPVSLSVTPEDPVCVSGPETVHPGDIIEIAVAAADTVDGARADVTADGLSFRGVSSGMCASYGLVVLPQMGPAAVVYTYEVSAAAGETVCFRLINVEAIIGAGSVICGEKAWRCVVVGGEDPDNAPQEAPAAVSPDSAALPAPGLPVSAPVTVAGPQVLRTGDVIVLTITANGPAEVRAEIMTEGLTFLRTASELCTAASLHLLPAAGLGAAAYVYRVDGPAGTRSSFAFSEWGVLWESRISAPLIGSSRPAVLVHTPPQGERDKNARIIYDLAGAGSPLTVRELQAALQGDATLKLEVRPSAGTRGKAADESVANGDMFLIRNAEGNCLSTGKILVRGDLAGSGRLDISQLVLLARALSGPLPPSAEILAAGDLNASGSLDIGDMVQLARILSGRAAASGRNLLQAA